ncbi:Tetratricopeptide repeat protein 30A [Hondaea fermentalgiana]|uniref:Tetratricopeptide repeat protein 30A n=1 Tax=Hondaea fermentalgiana TaxID=2315210 RepID=A0A2R5GSG9_9STRA|nr:Tetratricopeptide repeat protein 30A [Hondaea fermentalgiana]|eukprot:GBG33812.1 Tetratricopeptide repeat protein 30A [Hondaea fermentalgiana]
MATMHTSSGLATSHGGGGMVFGNQIAEGAYTEVIYGLLKEKKYDEVINKLALELQNFPRSRAALSLLAYSYYMLQDYPNAVRMYEQLTKLFPDVQEYRIYFAQSLYKAGLYPEATRACFQVDDPQYTQRMVMLQASIKYEQNDLRACESLADQCLADDPETIVCHACIAYKEGKFEEAREKFQEAMNTLGFQASLAHNIALCHYQKGEFGPALKHVAEIIERGVREHPELGVGSNADGIDVRSVGNSQVLHETALVEAFNLKAAIEYSMKPAGNLDAAREALNDMPPRSEGELDPVTLHNQALMNIDQDFAPGCRKLNFLLDNPPHPPQTFGNLLLLYCKNSLYGIAADVLAEHTHLTFKLLSPELYDFLDATIMTETSPEEAFRKYDDLAKKHVETLRKLTKNIQDSRTNRESDAVRTALAEYDQALERYIPVLMALARIYWEREHYAMVEKIFRQSSEFCSEHPVWKLNVAHVFFMQGKFKQAIHFYEPIVKASSSAAGSTASATSAVNPASYSTGSILDVTAIVLANLCVAYIMTSQNERAEDLMRRIEKEEERVAAEDPDKQCFHLCIVNLVIGNLYCSKGNMEFGISRIIKSLEPYDKKLGTDTWFYAKRCFLALAETLSKHMMMLPDASYREIIDFLDAADKHGKNVPTVIESGPEANVDPAIHNVSHEARLLKKMFLKLMD